jgi:hypothetical protein
MGRGKMSYSHYRRKAMEQRELSIKLLDKAIANLKKTRQKLVKALLISFERREGEDSDDNLRPAHS